jgi:hypothetical protein
MVTACLTLSAAMAFVGVVSCGLPFVPPLAVVALSLGTLGSMAAITAVVLAWPRGNRVRSLVIAIGVLLIMLNGVAIWAGQLGRHLIDYFEGK